MKIQYISLLTTSLALSACSAVGPNYQPPQPQTPALFHDIQENSVSKSQAAPTDSVWWKSFNDPQLNSLIDRAIAGNLPLQQTVLRIAGAREQIAQARGAWFPMLSGRAAITRQQFGLQGELDSNHVYEQIGSNHPEIDAALGALSSPLTLYQGNFDASWELDLWGKVRRSVEMANAQQQQSIESRNDVLVSLEAEVARIYLQLRGAQEIGQILETQIDVAQQILELTRSQQRYGLVPQSDVENARAQLSSLRAQLPQYQSQMRQAMNALAVLLGQPPGMLDAELQANKPLPMLPNIVAVGVPAALARRRPDVRQAEASLHAATANIGVSMAQLFPSLSLTGQFGMRNSETDYLSKWSSHFYSYGPLLSIPIFQGGKLVSSVKLARAQQENALLAYRQTVLAALRDVENALVSYHTDQQQAVSLNETVDALQNAFALASESYAKGLSSFIEVLDAQQQLTQQQQQSVAMWVQTNIDLVALYKALGGGWELYQQITLPTYSVFGPAVE